MGKLDPTAVKQNPVHHSQKISDNLRKYNASADPSKLSVKLETTYRNVKKKSSGSKKFVYSRKHSDETTPDAGSPRRTFSPRETQMNRWVNSVLGSTKSRRQLRDRVEQAIEDHKIFLNLGQCECVQKALTKRGWVEKPCSDITWRLISSKPLEDDAYREKYALAAWAHQLLQQCTPDLIWNHSGQVLNWRDIKDHQYVNQSPGPKIAFTSKDGLANCLGGSQWFQDAETVSVNFPRSYNLLLADEKAVFVNDYCLTACISLLKFLVALHDQDGFPGIFGDGQGTFEWNWVDFSIQQIQHYCRVRSHEDLDGSMVAPPSSIVRWDLFLSQYYELVSSDVKLCPIKKEDAKRKLNKCKAALENVSLYWPYINTDGTNNIWICKPGSRCRGRGITILNRLDKILEVEKSSVFKEIDSSWIVQKYIERPLLIHKTKFDIRQWFLVSCWNPLTVWFYKDCYFRFCSRAFNLEDFHESIHLCNTAVQCKYAHLKRPLNCPLPPDNIWEKATFKQHLREMGMEDKWSSLIYPGMKKGLLGVILPSQEMLLESGKTKIRKNSFELYGADFLISEDFVPWLIEVNATPMLHSPSPKFKKLTRQCLEDCMKGKKTIFVTISHERLNCKGLRHQIYAMFLGLLAIVVVLDWREDRNADTGKFELIYEQPEPLSNFIQVAKGETSIVGRSVSKPLQMKKKGENSATPSKSAKLNLKRRTFSSKMLAAVNPSLLALKLRKTLVNLFSNCNLAHRTYGRSRTTVKEKMSLAEGEVRILEETETLPALVPVIDRLEEEQEQSSLLTRASASRRLSNRSTACVSTSSVTPRSEAHVSMSAQFLSPSGRPSRKLGLKSPSVPQTSVSDTCIKMYALRALLEDLKPDDNKNDQI